MRTFALSVAAGMAVSPTFALAADVEVTKAPSPARPSWDIAFGSAVMSDYNIRGISVSAVRPSVTVYIEPRYKWNSVLELYAGASGSSIDFPNRAVAQVVYYAGTRSTFSALLLDVGLSYIDYPAGRTFNGLGLAATCTNGAFFFGQCNTSKGVVSFFEAYAKPVLTISDTVTMGGNVFYSPSWVNSGAPGTYASLTAKVRVPSPMLPPDIGALVSGEVGHYWFGTTDSFYGVPAFPAGVKLPDYKTWNIGLSLTYKSLSLDLRYYDTNLSKANCNVLTGDHTATFGGAGAITTINPSGLVSNWCSAALIAKLSFDTTLSTVRSGP